MSHAAFRLVAFHQLLPPIVFFASKYAVASACADTDGAVARASVSLSIRDPSMTPTVIRLNVTIRIHDSQLLCGPEKSLRRRHTQKHTEAL